MAAQITEEIMVGLTEKIRDGIENACEDSGMKPSQYARQAIFEKLVREGYLSKPSFKKFENSLPQPAE
ncbi:MAG: hypothetical protein WB689_25660 [Xanthobacteraceae bacterium]|jgi:hypothetical protein